MKEQCRSAGAGKGSLLEERIGDSPVCDLLSIELPPPQMEGGGTLMQALESRRSVLATGMYCYVPAIHLLRLAVSGDLRALTGTGFPAV